MKKNIPIYIIIFCLILSLCMPLTGCENREEPEEIPEVEEVIEPEPEPIEDFSYLTDVSTKTKKPESVTPPAYTGGDTLSVAYTDDVNTLNPFFAATHDEKIIADLMNVRLFPSERCDRLVTKKTESEFFGDTFEYEGIAEAKVDGNRIDIALNEDVYFSDGVNLTADDVIFSMYVLCDPAYTGENNLSAMPIEGLDKYRGEEELKWKLILADVQENGTKYKKNGNYTEEEFNTFLTAFDEVGKAFTQYIVNKCMENFGENYSRLAIGKSYGALSENENLQVAFAEFMWGYAPGENEDGIWLDEAGNKYDLEESIPELADFWHLIAKRYAYDISNEGINTEKVDKDDFTVLLEKELENHPELLVAVTDKKTADNISGIEKTGMYSLCITMESKDFDINDMFFYVCPLHVYGSRGDYDYLNNRFGFEKGNLHTVKTSRSIVGAGAYKFKENTEDGKIIMERNTLYYKGCPYITNIVFEQDGTDIIGGAQENYTVVPTVTNKTICIAMNTEKVKAGGDADSVYSIALRRAFSYLIGAYKYEYMPENAEPITSALPMTSYLYTETPEMTNPESALATAKGLLLAAGFMWDEESGTFDTAFTDSKMKYEIVCCNLPEVTEAVTAAAQALASYGFEINVTEVPNRKMYEHIVADDAADMWIAEFDGANEVLDYIDNEDVETLLAKADSAVLENVREAYIDKARELIKGEYKLIPLYTENELISFSERVMLESLPKKATANYSWQNCAEELQLNKLEN